MAVPSACTGQPFSFLWAKVNMRYPKPYLSVIQQRELLEQRGMVITDRAKAEHYLSKIGYYHLSAYWYPFRAQDSSGNKVDNLIPGTKFETIVDLYVFDKRLRLLLTDILERIEIAVKTEITLQLGMADVHAHLNPSNFHGAFTAPDNSGRSKLDKWCSKVAYEMQHSKEDFVKHFNAKYRGCDVPIWIATEVITFGSISLLFKGMKDQDKIPIASKFGFPRHRYLSSGLMTLTFVRNVCAHHGRLWNRPMVNQMQLPRLGDIPALDHLHSNTRLYSAISFAVYMLQTINVTSTWRSRFRDLLTTFPAQPHFMPTGIGFPKNWEQEALWK